MVGNRSRGRRACPRLLWLGKTGSQTCFAIARSAAPGGPLRRTEPSYTPSQLWPGWPTSSNPTWLPDCVVTRLRCNRFRGCSHHSRGTRELPYPSPSYCHTTIRFPNNTATQPFPSALPCRNPHVACSPVPHTDSLPRCVQSLGLEGPASVPSPGVVRGQPWEGSRV